MMSPFLYGKKIITAVPAHFRSLTSYCSVTLRNYIVQINQVRSEKMVFWTIRFMITLHGPVYSNRNLLHTACSFYVLVAIV